VRTVLILKWICLLHSKHRSLMNFLHKRSRDERAACITRYCLNTSACSRIPVGQNSTVIVHTVEGFLEDEVYWQWLLEFNALFNNVAQCKILFCAWLTSGRSRPALHVKSHRLHLEVDLTLLVKRLPGMDSRVIPRLLSQLLMSPFFNIFIITPFLQSSVTHFSSQQLFISFISACIVLTPCFIKMFFQSLDCSLSFFIGFAGQVHRHLPVYLTGKTEIPIQNGRHFENRI